ncbi:Uncharacterized protein Fot_52040 [Forsythia ovata]|uniref:Uncharacterized protein n=1 Tax=Forsythia ovata TaxID=205694 RepID=A0ABD1PKD4_9LAMI
MNIIFYICAAYIAIAESRGLAEGRDCGGGRLSDYMQTDSGGGGDYGVEKDERQEAKEWEIRRNAPKGHPVCWITFNFFDCRGCEEIKDFYVTIKREKMREFFKQGFYF